ncbi:MULTISPECIES: NAD(P)/FAD-dependent oxidoreductase [Burkholderia]|uniref:NAD(P)/FAD-dependent oxidoreductase n=1 Tax=Burkholderia TaxID=32008 RepID=UPI000679A1AA|nr:MULTISPECIES: NAD(P)/FAD-dependent oxidoreductase [Burkholderia]KWU26824.1 pyridine nucleotide-disulfide oxidoreductase [Burkholderia cenocepacia]QVN14855.1 NAD(P)/FAD-dependent oxidoreductase [Burkholderia sp. LAS2]RQU37768.1 NAD(P)/FAD-dependent oxidoreductase [Burkholderia cenocepacia]RQU90515.1 NAD(P)/FAD-dependent oxidoreductase [Burkholderia cenocepacia]RQV64794.1 NAD(P)/FAD-dependent oxidoreductase [Burkholderia cenocepacia]
MTTPTRIVIVGGGIAGLQLATRLGERLGRSGRAQITIVDRSPTHIWKPMLHTIAAGTRDVQQQQVIFLAHARDHGYTYQPGELKGLDRARRRVQLGEIRSQDGDVVIDARELDYDVLILALGSQANDFGVPGVREHCYFIDSQQQAETFNEALRMRVFRSIARDEPFRVAIVGAGATGVELAAELSRLLEVAQAYGDETVRERLQLTLLESGPRILNAFPPRISASAQRRLEQIGFRVLTSTRVTSADANGFHYGDGSFAEADLMVWAAGVKAPDFMQGLGGLDTNRANQIVVSPTLQASGDEHVFAIGDCASLQLEGQERPLPPTAQVATQQAEHLAKHLPAWLDGTPIPPFAFHDFGALVSISDYDAFGTLGQFGFFRGGFIQGRFAQFSHLMLYRRHQQALHGFSKATLLWIAERINGWVQPRIRLS